MSSYTTFYRLFATAVTTLAFATGSANAQCPVAAFCNPTNPPANNLAFGIGIRTVSIGPLSNTTPANSVTGTQNGYQDFSCTTGATLTAAVTYPISITTGPNANENVRVYIDYNNDGVFSVPAELSFSSNNALLHTGSVTIPATAVPNVPLRMRVVSEFSSASALPSPCLALEYGQAEDYFIVVIPNTAPALPGFTTSEPFTCDGTVSFTDQSQNAPISWNWNFGDPGSGAANTSAQQNPVHTFSAPGSYTISLTVCNANGCSTLVQSNYITYNSDLPLAAACTPSTLSYCCGYGIYNVTFAGINTSSADGLAGYQDFTCTGRATLVEGLSSPISITTSAGNNQNTAVWIDFNNDGLFTQAERVLNSLNSINPSGSITAPMGAVLNTPLRMRVISDFAGSTLTPCTNPQNGQAEDYTVTVVPNTLPPFASFGLAPFAQCDTVRQFTNTTQVNPASPATTYQWNFGDGGTSTDSNPVHTYSAANGAYTVTLIACNTFGCDTLAMPNTVTINNPCLNYCTPANNINTAQWISRVELGTINNSSGAGPGGYTDFSNLATSLVRGTSYSYTISMELQLQRTISIWIDHNRNGIFEQSERLVNQTSQLLPNGLRGITGTLTLPGGTEIGATRMRVIMRNVANNTNPCISNTTNTDIEDYTIIMEPQIPVAAFSSLQAGICNGLISFQDESENQPTSWTWDFGDGSPAVTIQNPTHTYQIATPATYTVTLTTCNSAGCSTVTMPDLVVITVPCTIPYCPSTGHGTSVQQITRVTTGTIDNVSTAEPGGYSDFTNQSTEILIGAFNPLTIQLANLAVSWGISVWIDYNQNAVFDTNERIFINQSNNLPGGNYGVTGNIQVPTTALPGPTRMRIIGRQGTNSDACAMNLISAETEDYTVTLVTIASNNVGVPSFTSPISGCGLSSAAQVCVVVQNFGTETQTNIPVQFTVGSFQSPVELVPDVLAPGATTNYCFTATANLASAGSYVLTAKTLLPGDIQPSNDSRNLFVNSFAVPNAGFTYSANGLSYSFTNSTSGATTYIWDFGDGTTSTLVNPVHGFPGAGTYTVTLIATSANGCVSSTTQTISGVSGTEDKFENLVKLFPNPSSGHLTIQAIDAGEFTYEISNSLGKLVQRGTGVGGLTQLQLNNQASGIYTVKVSLHNKTVVGRLVIQN